MPSFDVVCELDWAEVANALNQTKKELGQRFDFRGTEATAERTDSGILVKSNAEDRTRAALEVLQEKLIRRKVSLTFFETGDPEPMGLAGSKILVEVKEGVDRDKAKEILALIKESKLKVQASIQENMLRVTGKKKDDLQSAMALLRGAELGIELKYKNFRD